ncbi:VOC family protein [Sediminibacillus massiliensis]|uniref:VOC family protein n=1 Tax=Sediminibacillus massiliensis TaxID=1926277 RepID=UPI00098878B7|nr:VOC family protein [Sediminibacillus massiliensis]
MKENLIRVGTTYLPVENPGKASTWYVDNLNAELNYLDDDKAIINLANQSFFLVKSKHGQKANFIDSQGKEHFSVTFEVDGLEALETLHKKFTEKGMDTGDIEDRGHTGRNFVFSDIDGNMFDVWSQLSPSFKQEQR